MIWNWIKSIGWISTFGIVLAAIIFALAGVKKSKKRVSAKKKEEVGTNLLNSGVSKQIFKGRKMMESANKDKDAAIIAEERMEAQLNRMSENEDIADIADRFNKRKLRQSIDNTAT